MKLFIDNLLYNMFYEKNVSCYYLMEYILFNRTSIKSLIFHFSFIEISKQNNMNR